MKNIQQFFLEVKSEFSKIIWPNYDELIGSLIVVVALVTLFAIFLGLIDYAFYNAAEKIFSV